MRLAGRRTSISTGARWAPRSSAIRVFPTEPTFRSSDAVDRHTIDVRFWERGAGETNSSGTGSTGAAMAAIARGLVESPVTVLTPAGPLLLRIEDGVYLTGPAEFVAEGTYYLSWENE